MRKQYPQFSPCALCGSRDVKRGDALCRSCHAKGKTVSDIVRATPYDATRSIYGATVARELHEAVIHAFRP